MFFYLILILLQNTTLNVNPTVGIVSAKIATTNNFNKESQKNLASYSTRYNLAITYYQKKEFAHALAIWRQLFFKRPYDLKVWQAIKESQMQLNFSDSVSSKTLWYLIWIRVAPHIILTLLGIVWGIFILLLYQRKSLRIGLILVIGTHIVASYYYFTYKKNYHATLIENSSLKSAPNEEAVILSENLLAGQLLKIKRQIKDWVQVESHSNVGWLPASIIIPVKTSLNARLSPSYSDRVK